VEQNRALLISEIVAVSLIIAVATGGLLRK